MPVPHFPGKIRPRPPLRILLTHAGVRNPVNKKPFSEAMLFGIAGGIGIGVAAFHYAQENFSTFFIAGRHLWFDDLLYVEKLSAGWASRPSSGKLRRQRGEEQQRITRAGTVRCLGRYGASAAPSIADDMERRRICVVTVYQIDGDQALIGDMADRPVLISLAEGSPRHGPVLRSKAPIAENRRTESRRPDRTGERGLRCHKVMTMKSRERGRTPCHA